MKLRTDTNTFQRRRSLTWWWHVLLAFVVMLAPESVLADHNITTQGDNCAVCTRGGIASGVCPAASDGYTGQNCGRTNCCGVHNAAGDLIACDGNWANCQPHLMPPNAIHYYTEWGCSGGCGPAPTDPPVSYNPRGYLDSVSCSVSGVYGWAADRDDITRQTRIHLYFDSGPGDANPAGIDIGPADLASADSKAICENVFGGANAACNVCPSNDPTCRHRFSYPIPNTISRWYGGSINLRDGNTHTVRAYVINLSGTGGSNQELLNSPRSFTCAPAASPTPTHTPSPTATLTPSATPTLAPAGAITVNIMEGEGQDNGTGYCEAVDLDSLRSIGSTFTNQRGSLGGDEFTINSAGSASVTNDSPASTEVLQLYTSPAEWVGKAFTCGCKACQYSINTTSSAETNAYTFFVSRLPAWWQTFGGDVGANGGGIAATNRGDVENNNPSGQYTLASTGSMVNGVLMYTGDATEAAPISETDWTADSVYDIRENRREDFDYFTTLFELPDPLEDTYSGIGEPPPDGIWVATGGLTVSAPPQWRFDTNRNVVLFVEGDLVINHNISVDPGNFLAFIVSGDINIHKGVTELEGIFIADGVISTGTRGDEDEKDDQLLAEGMFIGWGSDTPSGGVLLERNLDNNSEPAEKFTYRPDFLISAPDGFLRPSYEWRETEPVAPEAP